MVLPVPRGRALRALSDRRPGLILSVLTLIALWLWATNRGPFSSTTLSDLFLYDTYHQMLTVEKLMPYRDFDFEYPPGALIPLLLAGGDSHDMSLFMLLCALVAQLVAWELGGARAGWAMALLPVAAGAMVRTHFDLLPAAMAMAGLWLVIARPRRGALELGFMLLALGGVTKLWPGAIGIVALLWLVGRGERAAAARGLAALAAVVLATCLPFVALGGFPSLMVKFHAERPVQIESTAATAIEVVGGSYVTGNPIRPDRFKSNGLDGGAADAIGLISAVALLGASIAVLWLAARRPTEDALIAAALGITLAFVCFSKVLSPQYMCWLLPLGAVALGRGRGLASAGALVFVASFATQVWFPRHYWDVVYQHAWAVTAVGVRNALLLAALAATVRALARSPRRAAGAPRSG